MERRAPIAPLKNCQICQIPVLMEDVMALVNAKIVRWTHALRQKGASKMLYRETQVQRDYITGKSLMLVFAVLE